MATPIRSGIPTTYASTNFRSRLEARWAAFFDLIGWRWVYEPVDAPGYIPDFLIDGPEPLFVEVGPCTTERDYRDKAQKSDRAYPRLRHEILIVGVSPTASISNSWDGLVAGLLGEEDAFAWSGGAPADGMNLGWGAAIWATCPHGWKVMHDFGDWSHRPRCGCREEPLLNNRYTTPAQSLRYRSKALEIETNWRKAGNAVRWSQR